jgi:phosphoesterase RecJ-like protein
VINIDHHRTNVRFGTVDIVRDLPSTAEIVGLLVRRLQVPLDEGIASALLVGLVTDTQCFRTGNVTARQLRTATRWIVAGASLALITDRVYGREPLSTVCLWGQALAGVRSSKGLIWTEISLDMIKHCQATPRDASGLASFLSNTEGMNVAVVFRQVDATTVDVSMRAGSGWDVSTVALALGGGGHARAAGLTAEGSLPEVRDAVLKRLRSSMGEQAKRHHDRAKAPCSPDREGEGPCPAQTHDRAPDRLRA